MQLSDDHWAPLPKYGRPVIGATMSFRELVRTLVGLYEDGERTTIHYVAPEAD